MNDDVVGAAPSMKMLRWSLLAAASALKFQLTVTCTQVPAVKLWAAVSTERSTPVLSVTSKNSVPAAVLVSENHCPLVCAASSNCRAGVPLQAALDWYQNMTVPCPSMFTPGSENRTPVLMASTTAAELLAGITAPRHTLPAPVTWVAPMADPGRPLPEESLTCPAPPEDQAPCSNWYSASGAADGT